ncbi:UDP-N-acetylglucosamine 1-carboxyvinyltransferase [Candidatus Dependentiae bacterium]|nr:UDP-N-acetylglucosamine 1-carboxyvinyltransferase [Candidatus Dependentiae bacterium]
MVCESIIIEKSRPLQGTVELVGAKNSVLVIMASLLLTRGKNRLANVPFSEDVVQMSKLLSSLGAQITADPATHTLIIDTTGVHSYQVGADMMKKMRASILVMGPLLARFGRAEVAQPGGDIIGDRPIDFHLKAFHKMGASIEHVGELVSARASRLTACTHVLEYPSVGATENIIMAAVATPGTTRIVNAAIEPEILDLIEALKKMGASIALTAHATVEIEGRTTLNPIDHTLLYDRLEAGSLLLAAAITGGELVLPYAPVDSMDVFLAKLEEMGHKVEIINGLQGKGISFKATDNPQAVSFRTMPYPGFPTDLQAPMMAALCVASGKSVIYETVFENRFVHARELQKMGACITIDGHHKATIVGVDTLYGASVIASDIRAAYALVLAGLVAQGTTTLAGVHHLNRGYEDIIPKLASLGAHALHTRSAE